MIFNLKLSKYLENTVKFLCTFFNTYVDNKFTVSYYIVIIVSVYKNLWPPAQFSLDIWFIRNLIKNVVSYV